MTGLTLRVARPTDHLAAITAMYTQGLGLSVLAQFLDHDGFDGTILGTREDPYHIEFTTRPGHLAGRAPTEEHLFVFYVPDRVEWETCCARMLAAGFRGVPSANPYWDVRGRTFEDLDGYRVVLQNAAWEADSRFSRTKLDEGSILGVESQCDGDLRLAHRECDTRGRQNADAVGFYASLGFSIVGRSATDESGRPFPILHMTRSSPTV